MRGRRELGGGVSRGEKVGGGSAERHRGERRGREREKERGMGGRRTTVYTWMDGPW